VDFSPFNPEIQNKNLDYKIVQALERISQAFKVLLWKESTSSLLTPIQIQMLVFLLYHKTKDNNKAIYLAKEFNLSKPTITESLKTMEQKGYIVKKIDPSDARSYLIHLTEKGEKIAKDVEFFAAELLESIKIQDTKEKENFFSILLKIIEHLQKKEIISVQRMCYNCAHYSKENDNVHFCNLLGKELKITEIRMDCPEHIGKP
jgi:DNA-binding MarR family transcriptional regulator